MTEIKLPTSAGSWKKQESSRKTSISALLTMPKPLILYGSQETVENSESDGTGCHDLSCLNVELKANFFTLLFHFQKAL